MYPAPDTPSAAANRFSSPSGSSFLFTACKSAGGQKVRPLRPFRMPALSPAARRAPEAASRRAYRLVSKLSAQFCSVLLYCLFSETSTEKAIFPHKFSFYPCGNCDFLQDAASSRATLRSVIKPYHPLPAARGGQQNAPARQQTGRGAAQGRPRASYAEKEAAGFMRRRAQHISPAASSWGI